MNCDLSNWNTTQRLKISTLQTCEMKGMALTLSKTTLVGHFKISVKGFESDFLDASAIQKKIH